MTAIQCEIRVGAYFDSAVLMQVQRGLLGLPAMLDAGVVMGTPANLELLDQSGLLADEARKAGVNDLVLVVKAESEGAAAAALSQVDSLLARRRSAVVQEFRPKSLETALQQLPEAGWILVSVPGRFAAGVAREALSLDRHVFLYSDNVSLEDEIVLKQTAQAKGLLVMGPDCGTAIVNGVGLGFANRIRRGAIGLVGASGTGLQAITSHIHALGGGVTHAIGTGSRDLKAEVGAITAHQALDLLVRDPDTKVIVLVSKPPAPGVATKLLTSAQAVGKPVIVDFIGYPPPGRGLGNLHFAASLSEAAEMAVSHLSVSSHQSSVNDRRSPIADYYLRGLFSGGTLAYEALLGLQAVLAPIYSNAPITEAQKLPDPLKSQAHTIVDLGDEVFMVGRLHPMIDNDLRLRRLKQEAADPEVGLILLDVVLGEGAHPDPASELAPVIEEIRDKRLEIVVVVVGTEDDPQNMTSQIERLIAAGATVFRHMTEAVDYVSRRLSPRPAPINPPVALDRFTQTPLAAINVGLESFYSSLVGQGAQVVHVDWRPPAGGNERLAAILAKMKKK